MQEMILKPDIPEMCRNEIRDFVLELVQRELRNIPKGTLTRRKELCEAILTVIVLAKLTSVCYITRYANGKNKTTNRELRQIPAGIRTCCHTQKGLRRLLTFSMASTITGKAGNGPNSEKKREIL